MEQKPDWKQWIPIYGIFQALKDDISIINYWGFKGWIGSATWHAFWISLFYAIIKISLGTE